MYQKHDYITRAAVLSVVKNLDLAVYGTLYALVSHFGSFLAPGSKHLENCNYLMTPQLPKHSGQMRLDRKKIQGEL